MPTAAYPTSGPPSATFEPGVYRLKFQTQAYFRQQGQECFYPTVPIVFEIQESKQHYHVPLLISPYGYSTYRGS
jgi:5-hydroxyisourate hydrolase